MSDYKAATRRVELSVGESGRILRELSQNRLAELSGIPRSTMSAIEKDPTQLGVERAKALARALRCHQDSGKDGLFSRRHGASGKDCLSTRMLMESDGFAPR
ncbi:MAG: helix-turn-helix transcriptional regulator [Gammaproteobacteria bacterium]|jgi:transcriptional regulator with XRE-family HTH domain